MSTERDEAVEVEVRPGTFVLAVVRHCSRGHEWVGHFASDSAWVMGGRVLCLRCLQEFLEAMPQIGTVEDGPLPRAEVGVDWEAALRDIQREMVRNAMAGQMTPEEFDRLNVTIEQPGPDTDTWRDRPPLL